MEDSERSVHIKSENKVIEDPCLICGKESHVGAVGIQNGEVYHHHYCNTCHYKRKMRQDDSHPVKPKKQPSKIEKEFRDAGLRVQPKNSGTQLVIGKKFTKVDYWPTTQKWYNRNTGESGVGKKGVFTNFGL